MLKDKMVNNYFSQGKNCAEAAILAANKENILGTVIGHTTQCIDRVVIRDDETRFLEPANGDELNKVIW